MLNFTKSLSTKSLFGFLQQAGRPVVALGGDQTITAPPLGSDKNARYRSKGGRNTFGQCCADSVDVAQLWQTQWTYTPLYYQHLLATFAHLWEILYKLDQFCLFP